MGSDRNTKSNLRASSTTLSGMITTIDSIWIVKILHNGRQSSKLLKSWWKSYVQFCLWLLLCFFCFCPEKRIPDEHWPLLQKHSPLHHWAPFPCGGLQSEVSLTIKATKHLRTSCAVLSFVITAINSTCTCNYQMKSHTWAENCKMCPKKLKLPQNCPELDFTWDWQSSEWEVARGHAAVGKDCGVDPTKERRHSRVHIREAL